VPQIQDIRRSPIWLVPRGQQMHALRTFIPELKCSLEQVTHCSDGYLEFSKKKLLQSIKNG